MNKERVATLRKRVAKDPYDAASWESLVSEADRARRGSERNAELTAVYEDLLSKSPTAAGYWREYADHQMSCSGEAEVKAVFSRCLLTCLSVDLWRAYLNFIKRLNEPRGTAGLPEIRQAYEFSLDRLGHDSASGGLWQDYLAFLQAPKQGSPEYAAVYGEALEGQEESQRVAALRRAYQRALLVPTPQLEGLWRAYEGFEMAGSNKQLARRLLDETRPKYQAARGLLREREGRLAGLNLKAMALPPGRGGGTQQAQAALWREYLGWERGNPQQLDEATYAARVCLAYDQALMVLFHFPDIWLDYARWHQAGGGGGPAAAAAVLKKGRGALPAALLLHFAAADLQEVLGNAAGAKVVFEELVENLKAPEEAAAAAAPAAAPTPPAAAAAPAVPAAAAALPGAAEGAQQAPEAAATASVKQEEQQGEQQQAADAAAVSPGVKQEQEQQSEAAAGEGAGQPHGTPVKEEQQQQQAPAEAASPAPSPAQQPEQQAQQQQGIQLSEQQGTLAWIQYMRFARRTEGIMAARKLFMRARKWPGMQWQAYAASALMEWRHEAKDTIPRNIFELGLKGHLGQPGLVLAYADFLLGLGDIHNTRALFERALAATAPEAAHQLWDVYLAFEYDVGSLAAAAAVEQRRQEAAAALREAAAAAAAGAALDGKPAPAAGAAKAPAHEVLQVALLKYKVQGLWPGSEVQRLHFERLLGQAPALEGAEPRPREPETGGRREREREREREPARDRGERERSDRDREPRRHRERTASPPPRRGGSNAPRSPARDAEPLRLSRELAQLMSQLPPPHALDGRVPDVERVVQIILNADLSPDGIIAHEVAAARERRRQRRLAEGGGPPGPQGGGSGGPIPGPAGGYGGPAGGPGGHSGVGQKRKVQDYDSGSESDDDQQYAATTPAAAAPPGGAPGAAADGGGFGGPPPGAGGAVDVWRQRRKGMRL